MKYTYIYIDYLEKHGGINGNNMGIMVLIGTALENH